MMFLRNTCFAGLLLALSVSPLYGQREGLSFGVSVFHVTSWGGDLAVGDIYIHTEGVPLDGSSDYTFVTSHTAIASELKPSLAWGLNAMYRKPKSRWMFGASFLKAGLSGNLSSTIASIADVDEASVRMWGHTKEPPRNDLDPSGKSPIDYWTGSALSFWTLDLFVMRALIEEKNKALYVTFGSRLARASHARREGQALNYFVYNAFGEGLHGNDEIFIESTGSARTNVLRGLRVGLRARLGSESLGLHLSASESFLFGMADREGSWFVSDRILVYTGPEGGALTEVSEQGFFTNSVPYAAGQNIAIPVTDFKVMGSLDFFAPLELNVGMFLSMWHGMPMSPEWTMPGAWSLRAGSGWNSEKRTVLFTGITASIGVNF